MVSDSCKQVRIGMILGFTYLDGTTFKARGFSQISALVAPDPPESDQDVRRVGVLSAFYNFNDDGDLIADPGCKHKYVNIEMYFGTIKPPLYKNERLIISKLLVEKIKLKNGKREKALRVKFNNFLFEHFAVASRHISP